MPTAIYSTRTPVVAVNILQVLICLVLLFVLFAIYVKRRKLFAYMKEFFLKTNVFGSSSSDTKNAIESIEIDTDIKSINSKETITRLYTNTATFDAKPIEKYIEPGFMQKVFTFIDGGSSSDDWSLESGNTRFSLDASIG